MRRLLTQSIIAFLATLTVLLVAPSPCQAGGTKRPPNIVFILADDLGWTDVACQGSKFYETPNIDKLAAKGLRLTSFYQYQNCTPTRAALMTGQYAPRTGMYTVGSLERGTPAQRKMLVPVNVTNLPLDRVTIAGALKSAGYATALYGKWHLGEGGKYHPSQRGFDEAIVTMGKHFDFVTNPQVDYAPGTYLADFLTDLGVRFIDKNKDRPFFLYLAHFGVHSPWVAKKDLIGKYQHKPAVGGHFDPTYAAMIDSIDQSVGRIVARLEELKLAENTIIIFTSDNGGVGGYEAAGIPNKSITNNAPLRGGKGMLYEGGLRVPFIVRWDGKIRPKAVSDEPAAHIDIFPTFLQLAGGKAPKQILDGVSLVPLWTAPDEARLPREALYFHFPGYLEAGAKGWRTTPCGMIRAGDFSLLEFYEDGRLELYNLKDDLGQKSDLAKQLPEKTKELHRKFQDWRQALKAAMPELKKDEKATAPLIETAVQQKKDDPPQKEEFDGLKALKHPDPDVRYRSAQLLADLGPVGKFAVPTLREMLKEEQSLLIRVKVAEALWKIAKQPVRDLLPTLLDGLKDNDPVVRANAAAVLGQLGADAKPAVGALSKALGDKEFAVRAEVAVALGEIGPAARAAVPALLETLKNDDIQLLEPFVLGTLGKIGEDAVPHLVAALTAKEYRLRRGAVYALGLIGKGAAEAVEPLTKLLQAPEADLRSLAAVALGKIGDAARGALPMLTGLLKDKGGTVRISAAVALWRIDGSTLGRAVLVAALLDENAGVRESACKACVELGDAKILPVMVLRDCLKDPVANVRVLAAEALGRGGKAAMEALPELRKLFKDAYGPARVSAALAVWRIDGKVKEVAPLLVEWLADKNVPTRRAAAAALGEIGPEAKEAGFETLVEVYRGDQSFGVRQAAAAALKKIDAKAAAKMGVR
jgi:arylsulfatase A-like enzyme/HEAT repeat protein